VRIASDKVDGTNMVVLVPNTAAGAEQSIGFLPDGSDWFGTIEFRWNSTEMLYQSEAFQVTLRSVIEVQADGTNVATKTLRIRFPEIKTTRAENGSCFLMAPNTNVTQAIQGATADNALALRPRVPIDVLDVTQDLNVQFYWEPDCAYRIMVGGRFAFPSPSVGGGANYFDILAATTPIGLTAAYEAMLATVAGIAGSWGAATTLNANTFYGQLLSFSMQGSGKPFANLRNSQPGTLFEGVTSGKGAPVRCMSKLQNPLDVADETGINRLAGMHLLTVVFNAGQDFASSIGGAAGAAGPNFVYVEETDVGGVFDWRRVLSPLFLEGNVRQSFDDPGPQNDAVTPSLWYWLRTLLPAMGRDITAQVDGAGAAVPANLRIPPSTTWFPTRVAETKDMLVRITGNAALGQLQATADTTLADTIVMVPTVLRQRLHPI